MSGCVDLALIVSYRLRKGLFLLLLLCIAYDTISLFKNKNIFCQKHTAFALSLHSAFTLMKSYKEIKLTCNKSLLINNIQEPACYMN